MSRIADNFLSYKNMSFVELKGIIMDSINGVDLEIYTNIFYIGV